MTGYRLSLPVVSRWDGTYVFFSWSYLPLGFITDELKDQWFINCVRRRSDEGQSFTVYSPGVSENLFLYTIFGLVLNDRREWVLPVIVVKSVTSEITDLFVLRRVSRVD